MMTNYKAKDYRVFEMFSEQWALVTAGTMERFNSCTLGWGSLGNIWGHDGKTCPIVTVYVHPARYTSEFLTENDTFTVSFYPESCRNVHISDCHISVGDDCITIKSGRDAQARRLGVPCENITITNCTMLSGGAYSCRNGKQRNV